MENGNKLICSPYFDRQSSKLQEGATYHTRQGKCSPVKLNISMKTASIELLIVENFAYQLKYSLHGVHLGYSWLHRS